MQLLAILIGDPHSGSLNCQIFLLYDKLMGMVHSIGRQHACLFIQAHDPHQEILCGMPAGYVFKLLANIHVFTDLYGCLVVMDIDVTAKLSVI